MKNYRKVFEYERTLKTDPSNDFINFQTFLLITSKQLTKFFFKTRITPHQVILLSLAAGVCASLLIINDNKTVVAAGAVLLFYKNVLDKVDGSLARAKGLASRRGRFYDSIADFIVSLCLFASMSWKLSQDYSPIPVYIIGFLGLVFSMLQCSYFIYYEVAFIKFTGRGTINRLVESVTEEDIRSEDKLTLMLQRIFMAVYGWQDMLVRWMDRYFINRLQIFVNKSHSVRPAAELRITDVWYQHKKFLTAASFLGIGSHMVMIAGFAVAGRFEYYFAMNLIIWNLLLICCIIYHYYSVRSKLRT